MVSGWNKNCGNIDEHSMNPEQTNNTSAMPQRCGNRSWDSRLVGFTLIELLVVISIIGILASLVLSVSGAVSRKARESRIRSEMNRLVTLIDNYKARLGTYPPSNERLVVSPPATRAQLAGLNQLYYELSGTVFKVDTFIPIGREAQAGLGAAQITSIFGVDGFANSARNPRDVRVSTAFKPSERKMVKEGASVFESLAVPLAVASGDRVPPSVLLLTAADGTKVYPWFYDPSSTNRFNAETYDLWAEVVIGKNITRISNWEPRSVVIGKVP